jgi:hypothetical protein
MGNYQQDASGQIQGAQGTPQNNEHTSQGQNGVDDPLILPMVPSDSDLAFLENVTDQSDQDTETVSGIAEDTSCQNGHAENN